MLARIDLRGRTPSIAELRSTLPRGEVDVDAVLHTVRPIVDAVRERGVDAVLELSEMFDKVRPRSVRVPVEELDRALEQLDPQVRAALEESVARARRVHADQRRSDTVTQVVDGGTVTERWVPVDRVGLYVPGGNAVLASSVVMNVVPAQAAEVAELVVCSPPQADNHGLPDPTILAACALLGVQEVWAAGGAQAIALLALGGIDTVAVDGAAELTPVDLITGPGNIYVTAAKRLLRGMVGIDSEAGPPASSWPTRWTRRWPSRLPSPSTPIGYERHCLASSPASFWCLPWRKDCGWSTRTPPNTWRSRPPTPPLSLEVCATRGRCSSGRGHRSASATTARGAITCYRRPAARGTPRG
jgi:hypothetical protein